MKKVLLATTALVSAGVLAGAGDVAAQDKPISLTLGGYYRAAFGVISDDDGVGERGAGFRNHQVSQDVEVHFKGEVTLSRGVTVGVNIEMEAQEQAGDQIDETWAYFKGRWGEFRFGDEDGVTRLAQLSAPNAGDNFGVNSPFFVFTNNGTTVGGSTGNVTNSTSLDLANDATKLLYFTPRISGFQAGVSYAPDGTQDVRTMAQGGRTKTGGIGEIFAIMGNYSGKIGDVDLQAMIGYQTAKAETPGATGGVTNADPDTILGGLVIGFAGWQFGGSYQKIDDRGGQAGRESEVFDIGIAYMPGPWGVSLGWSRGEYKVSGTTAAVIVEDQLDHYSLGARYVLGPGIRLNAALEYQEYDPGIAGNAKYDSLSFLVGTTIIF